MRKNTDKVQIFPNFSKKIKKNTTFSNTFLNKQTQFKKHKNNANSL